MKRTLPLITLFLFCFLAGVALALNMVVENLVKLPILMSLADASETQPDAGVENRQPLGRLPDHGDVPTAVGRPVRQERVGAVGGLDAQAERDDGAPVARDRTRHSR